MNGKVKLSKRQIKEDKFTTFVLRSKQQVLENWQFLVIGVVVVALLVTAVVYYLDSRQSAKEEAANLFSKAYMEYRSGNRQVALASLIQLIEEYDDKTVNEQATYALGNINFEARNYADAIRYWEMYLAKYQNNPLNRAAAYAGIASCHENQGNFSEAAQSFLEAISAFPDGPLDGDYRAGAMRNFLAMGDLERAQAQLDTIEEKYGETDLFRRAARYFAEKSRS